MRRTTTPTHTFQLKIDPQTITNLVLTYAQSFDICGCTEEEYEQSFDYDIYEYRGYTENAKETKIVLEKHLADFTINENSISVTLTQEETNLFVEDIPVEMQLHVMIGETSLQSDIITVPCRKVLNDEVLT